MTTFAQDRTGRPRFVGALVVGVTLVALVAVSRRTPATTGEARTLAAIASATEVVHAVAQRGPAGLVGADARAAFAPAAGRGGALVPLGAWSRESVGRFVDPLLASRLPWLALGALGAGGLFRLLRPRVGTLAAAGGVAALLATPAFHREAATASEAIAAVSIWLLVLAEHARTLSRERGSPRARAAAAWRGAAWLGAGLAVTFASAWVLLLAWAQVVWARRAGARARGRHGELSAPALVLPALVVAPALALAFTPAVWGASPADVARWLTHDLQAELAAGAAPPPGTAAALGAYLRAVAQPATLPLLVLGAVGLAVLARDALARRFASGALRPAPDPTALGALLLIGVAVPSCLAAVTASPLAVVPPRAVTVLPFVAALAAVGVRRAVARRLS